MFGIGPAGTGKTYLAVAFAAQCLERGLVERIILSRPAVEAGERLGFLPGDMREKVDPYLRPLYDALYDVLPPEKVERDLEQGVIEIAPLGVHARAHAGQRLRHSRRGAEHHQHADEDVSDATRRELEDGHHGRSVADRSAVRHDVGPRGSGAVCSTDVPDITAVRFANADVVRRDLVAKIVEAYDRAGAEEALRCPAPPRAEVPVRRRKAPLWLVLDVAQDADGWSPSQNVESLIECGRCGARARIRALRV